MRKHMSKLTYQPGEPRTASAMPLAYRVYLHEQKDRVVGQKMQITGRWDAKSFLLPCPLATTEANCTE